MNSKTLIITLKQVGSLLILLGTMEIVPGTVSCIYSEWYSAAGFLLSAIITLSIGFAFYWLLFHAEDPQYNHSLVVAASGWLGVTLAGGLPFFIIAHITPTDVMSQFIHRGADYTVSSLSYFKNPLHCFFESMSAYTTTGLSMAVHEPSVGKGVLFYRSFAQWVGGAGFIVMVLAVFRQTSGKSAILLYGSEATGERLKPKIIETARAIWKVYLWVTLFSVVYLFIGTWLVLPDYPLAENIFDSVNHAMAGQSTGGFSTLDNHMADYHSVTMDMLYLLPMILGSFSIPFYYKVIFERKYSEWWKDIQTRALIIAFVFGSMIQSFLLFVADSVPNPVREGIFQFVSAMSTTGWQTSNIGNWDWMSVVFIVSSAMFVGGASGATVGGIKMIRALVIRKGLRWQVSRTFLSSNTVKLIKFNGKSMLPGEMNEEFTKAASFAIIFFLLILGSSFLTMIFAGDNFTYTDALFESASAQATAGLSSGITDPSMPPVLEWVYIFQMWAGRLEVIPVLALVRAVFFGTRPKII
ncbi:MAG: TrkH family potassium uptake protein [Prolixibacteraceae bacterium]|jgi:trk system potassium uptake protein TrkH|nr:TrkH family potassium uptake protein [Prolixibacteraceae bacterium]